MDDGDSGSNGLKMVTNTSLHPARIERKGCPCFMMMVWFLVITITFISGWLGPDVLDQSSHGTLRNASEISTWWAHEIDDFQEGDDEISEDGSNVKHHHKKSVKASSMSFNYEPHPYKQFFVVSLHMLHPGHVNAEQQCFADTALDDDQVVACDTKKSDHVSWTQNWGVCEVNDPDVLSSKQPAATFQHDVTNDVLSKYKCPGKLKHRKSTIHCEADKKWCRPTVMFQVDHIRDTSYYFETQVAYDKYAHEDENTKMTYKVTIETMNAAYTSFEMGFKYFFIFVTLCIALWRDHGYIHCLLKARIDHLSHQHWWILGLLVGLVWFNEPFMVFRVFFHLASDPLSKFNMLTSTLYVSFLMYYWLVLLDDCRVGSASGWKSMNFKNDDRATKQLLLFYVPKMTLIAIIWSLTFASYCVYAVMSEEDPSFRVVNGTMAASAYKNLAIASLFFVVVYMLWTMILFAMVVLKSCTLPVPYKWLFGISSFTLLMVIVGMFVGIAYPIPSSPFVFVGFYGVINTYVWVMALAWTPMEIGGGVLGVDAEMEMGDRSDDGNKTISATTSPFTDEVKSSGFSALGSMPDDEEEE